MALILLKETYTANGSGQNELGETYYSYLRRTWNFNDATLLVEFSEVELQEGVDYTPPADYSRSTTQIFFWNCSGTTRVDYLHDGNGGFTTQETANSTDCGYSPTPADGTFLRNDCNGYDLTEVLADGSGGERWGNVVEANSTTCGYTPPPVYGCTDPDANNYDPSANTDDGTCTYDPKTYSEVKEIVVQPCRPGVYLRWYNSLGGVEGWLFGGKVTYPVSSTASGEYAQETGLRQASRKTAEHTMVVRTAGLNFNQYRAVCGLFTSPLVWIHHEDGSTEEVFVLPGSVDPDPYRKSYELAIQLATVPPNALLN